MYIIKKINDYNEKVWDNLEAAKVSNFPWDETGYKPNTEVKLFYTDDSLHIRFKSEEKAIRVEGKKLNDSVYQDSCVEFFFMPDPSNDNRYLNFEMNAAGALLLQIDEKTTDRAFVDNIDLSMFEIKTDVNHDNYKEFANFKPWSVEYKIPFSFIRTYFKDFNITSGYVMRGNFYKCGDNTEIPHYGCWNNITNEYPAFHKPEFFGEIVFE